MIFPTYIKKGDRIRIVSPAGKVLKDKTMPGIEILKNEGFEVIIGEHVFAEYFQFAGTDEQRTNDLQEAIDDPETKAIICARGGYGTIRLLESIDFSSLKENPKWLVGFSDITVLHSVLNKMEIASIHGAMPAFYEKDGKPTQSFQQLIKCLKGEQASVEFNTDVLNRKGNCVGELVGGNLSLLYSLNATPFNLDTDGKILFVEDLSEYLYHLDRMMMNLKLSGRLSNLAGLQVGGFTEMKDNGSPFGKSAKEIIWDAVKDYGYPVAFNFPAGHIDENMPLIFGAAYQLDVDSVSTLSIAENG